MWSWERMFVKLCKQSCSLVLAVSCESETIVSYMYGQNHVLFVRYGAEKT